MSILSCIGSVLLALAAAQPQAPSQVKPAELGPNHIRFIAREHRVASPLVQYTEVPYRQYELCGHLRWDGKKPSDGYSGAENPSSAWTIQQREFLALTKRAGLMHFEGGTFMGWYDLAYPEGYRSYLPQVITHALKSKKPIIASGGACAFLSGGVVVSREELDRPQRNPALPANAPEARVAFDCTPGMMFGSDDWAESSPLRLLRSMHDNRMNLAAYFVGDVVMDFDRTEREIKVWGPGHLILFDLTRARRFPDGLRDARLSTLGHGDTWRVGSRPIRMADGKRDVPPGASKEEAEQLRLDSAGPSGADLLLWLESTQTGGVQRSYTQSKWILNWDERSERQEKADASGHRTWLNLPLDVRWPKRRQIAEAK